MNIEREIKFLHVDKDELRGKLADQGYTCVSPEYLMTRKTFHPQDTQKNEWFRVRTEGDYSTMTYKCIHENSIDGMEEVETRISDIEAASQILIKTGLKNTSTQENYREVWVKDGIEACLDTWPGLNVYLELEASGDANLKEAASNLGFQWDDGKFGGVEVVYEIELGIEQSKLISLPEITFNNIPR